MIMDKRGAKRVCKEHVRNERKRDEDVCKGRERVLRMIIEVGTGCRFLVCLMNLVCKHHAYCLVCT